MPSLEDWIIMLFYLISALIVGVLSALAPLCVISLCTEKRSSSTPLFCLPSNPSSHTKHLQSAGSAFHPSLVLDVLSRYKLRLTLYCGVGVFFSLLSVWIGHAYHFPIFALTMPTSLIILLLDCSTLLIATEIALHDLETRTIPYEYSGFLLLFGFTYVLLSRPRDLAIDFALALLIFGVLLAISFFELWKNLPLSLGAGDIVLMPIIAFIVGFQNFAVALAISLALSLLILVALRTLKQQRISLKETIAFGPILALCLALGQLIPLAS